MDYGWLWYINVGSTVTNVPFWVGDVDRGESYECVGAGTHGKSLEFPLSFVVNQKLLYAILILLPCPAIPPNKRI